MARFDGKVVLITGAASGIGKASAERIASEGGNATLPATSQREYAIIETLRGKRVTMLTNQSEGRTQRALSAADARAVADQLTRTAAELRRDQTRLTTLFTELNGQRQQLAVTEVRRRAAPTPRP